MLNDFEYQKRYHIQLNVTVSFWPTRDVKMTNVNNTSGDSYMMRSIL